MTEVQLSSPLELFTKSNWNPSLESRPTNSQVSLEGKSELRQVFRSKSFRSVDADLTDFHLTNNFLSLTVWMKSMACRILPTADTLSLLFSQLQQVGIWNSPRSTLTLSAESKQVRMFVILLTAQESGCVILGMLIDSRGKVRLCLRTQTQKKILPIPCSLKHREETLMYTKDGDTRHEAGSWPFKFGDCSVHLQIWFPEWKRSSTRFAQTTLSLETKIHQHYLPGDWC